MDMPKPGDAHKKLGALVGEWSGGETLHPAPWDPAGGKATATVSNRWIVDGFAVVQDYQQRRGGKVNLTGHGVFWYDPGKQEYVMFWTDSMGGTGSEWRGQFNGGVLQLAGDMGPSGKGRVSFDVGTPNAYGFKMEMSQDGQNWMPGMEGAYKKGGARKAAARPAKKAAPRKKAAPKKAAKKKAAKKKKR
jgi:hypothetical protein